MIRFVKDEALQDEQFASNMWRRAITSSPQLTTYHLGFAQQLALYEDLAKAKGKGARVSEITDRMLELGPVPVARYRERFLPKR